MIYLFIIKGELKDENARWGEIGKFSGEASSPIITFRVIPGWQTITLKPRIDESSMTTTKGLNKKGLRNPFLEHADELTQALSRQNHLRSLNYAWGG